MKVFLTPPASSMVVTICLGLFVLASLPHETFAQSAPSTEGEPLDLEACFARLDAADTNGNGAVDLDEYQTFIDALEESFIQCNGGSAATALTKQQAADLSLQQRAAFMSLACQCRDPVTGDASCCLNGNAQLSTTHATDAAARTPQETLSLTVICTVTEVTLCPPEEPVVDQDDGGDSTIDGGDGGNDDPISRDGGDDPTDDDDDDDGFDWWVWLLILGGGGLLICGVVGYCWRSQTSSNRGGGSFPDSPEDADKNLGMTGPGVVGSSYKDDDESSDGRPTERFEDDDVNEYYENARDNESASVSSSSSSTSSSSNGRPMQGDEEEALGVFNEEEALQSGSAAGNESFQDEITERNDIAIFAAGDPTETEASAGEEMRIVGVGIVDDLSTHDPSGTSVHDTSGREILIEATDSVTPKDSPESEEGRAPFFDDAQQSEPQVIRNFSNRVSTDAPADISTTHDYSEGSSLEGSESHPRPGEIAIGIGGSSSHHSQSQSSSQHPQPGEITIGMGGSSHHTQSSSQYAQDADEEKSEIAASVRSHSTQPVSNRATKKVSKRGVTTNKGKDAVRDDDTYDESVSTAARNEEESPVDNSFDWILRSLQS